ncbi:hypothetical protein F5Y18DRAFT_394734 [Xylariaceae sp. FL1019]|nr:hypothetical protein F5Y18DRAFT_394734 [Xylariaceae sp. FL1019]
MKTPDTRTSSIPFNVGSALIRRHALIHPGYFLTARCWCALRKVNWNCSPPLEEAGTRQSALPRPLPSQALPPSARPAASPQRPPDSPGRFGSAQSLRISSSDSSLLTHTPHLHLTQPRNSFNPRHTISARLWVDQSHPTISPRCRVHLSQRRRGLNQHLFTRWPSHRPACSRCQLCTTPSPSLSPDESEKTGSRVPVNPQVYLFSRASVLLIPYTYLSTSASTNNRRALPPG